MDPLVSGESLAHLGFLWSPWQIGPFQSAKGERAKLKVKVRLNLHGIVSVDSATVSPEICGFSSFFFFMLQLFSEWRDYHLILWFWSVI